MLSGRKSFFYIFIHFAVDLFLHILTTQPLLLQAQTTQLAEEGLAFMKEMLELAKTQQEVLSEPRVVQLMFAGIGKC